MRPPTPVPCLRFAALLASVRAGVLDRALEPRKAAHDLWSAAIGVYATAVPLSSGSSGRGGFKKAQVEPLRNLLPANAVISRPALLTFVKLIRNPNVLQVYAKFQRSLFKAISLSKIYSFLCLRFSSSKCRISHENASIFQLPAVFSGSSHIKTRFVSRSLFHCWSTCIACAEPTFFPISLCPGPASSTPCGQRASTARPSAGPASPLLFVRFSRTASPFVRKALTGWELRQVIYIYIMITFYAGGVFWKRRAFCEKFSLR